jgi:tRNA modification GTPase
LCLWVVDGSAAPVWPDPAPARCLTVINKSDLPAAWDTAAADAVTVSAQTGAGLADLCERVSRTLVPHPPPAGAAVPFTPVLAGHAAATVDAVQRRDLGDARKTLATLVELTRPA